MTTAQQGAAAPPLFSDDEALAVVRAALTAAGTRGQTTEELDQVLEWAIGARIDASALELLLAGQLGVFVRDGELIWKALPESEQ